MLILSWCITLYTLWQMVEMHEMVPGKRFDRYHELGQEAFGEKLGLWIVVPQQLLVEVSVDIVYMVTGGNSIQKLYNLYCTQACPLATHKSIWIAIFGSVHLFLSQLPNFNSISGISLAAAIMSLRFVQCSFFFFLQLLEFSHYADLTFIVVSFENSTTCFVLIDNTCLTNVEVF